MRQKKNRIIFPCIILVVLSILAACILYLANINWGFSRSVGNQEKNLRMKLVDAAEQWIGSNTVNGRHQEIIDIYNSHTPLAQNYKVKYTDKWCAAFVSVSAIQSELTDLIPTECGCQRQIGLFVALGRWEESDEYTPLPGDIIYYSAEGADTGDNTGWSDHVGIVSGTWGRYIKVIEGNVAGAVAVRYILIGDASIRGYGLPDYASAC